MIINWIRSPHFNAPNRDFSEIGMEQFGIIFPLVIFFLGRSLVLFAWHFKQMYHLSNVELFISMSHVSLSLSLFSFVSLECSGARTAHSFQSHAKNVRLSMLVSLHPFGNASMCFGSNIKLHCSAHFSKISFSCLPANVYQCSNALHNDMHFCWQLKWTVILPYTTALACFVVVSSL